MRNKLIGLCIAALLIALSAWSPWLTQAFAETRAVDSFNKSWLSVIGGWEQIAKAAARSNRNESLLAWK